MLFSYELSQLSILQARLIGSALGLGLVLCLIIWELASLGRWQRRLLFVIMLMLFVVFIVFVGTVQRTIR